MMEWGDTIDNRYRLILLILLCHELQSLLKGIRSVVNLKMNPASHSFQSYGDVEPKIGYLSVRKIKKT